MISQPLDDVVIDCFALPEDAYRGRTRMVYCAVLEKTRMQHYAQLVRQADLHMARASTSPRWRFATARSLAPKA